MPSRALRAAGPIVACLAALALAPALAHGAGVRVDGSTVRFEAGAGETNVVTFDYGLGLEIVDSGGAALTPGAGCSRPDASDTRRVACTGTITRTALELGDGDDSLESDVTPWGGSLSVDAGPGADRIAGDRWWLVDVAGGSGDDRITGARLASGGAGRDRLEKVSWGDGGPDDDVLAGDEPAADLRGGAGNDSLTVSELGRTSGGDGDDRLAGGEFADGGAGDDSVTGAAQARGGDGNDRIIVPPWGSWRETGGSAGAPHDEPWRTCRGTLRPRMSDPYLFDGPTVPGAVGGPGNDVITGSSSADWLIGDAGDDVISGAGNGDAVDGGAGADRLAGNDGADLVVGRDGNDSIDGGGGADRLDGGLGGDALTSGPGTDALCYDDHPRGVTVDLRAAGGDGSPGEGDSVAPDVELLGGSRFRDRLVAGEADVSLRGGDGDDTLLGGAAADDMEGGFGSDTIRGGRGDDVLRGGPEARNAAGVSEGDEGGDYVDGGDGADLISGARGDDYLRGGAGSDQINAGEAAHGSVDGAMLNYSPIVSFAHGDQIWCGSAVDEVEADYPDGIGRDCEVRMEGTRRWRKVAVRRGVIKVKVRCAWTRSAPCRGRLRLSAAERGRTAARSAALRDVPGSCRLLRRRQPLIGSMRFVLRAGRVGTLRVKIGRRARRLVARRRCVPAILTLAGPARANRRFESSRTLAVTR